MKNSLKLLLSTAIAIVFLLLVNGNAVDALQCRGIFNCCMLRLSGVCQNTAPEVPCTGSTNNACTSNTGNPGDYCTARGWTVEDNGCFWVGPTSVPGPTPTDGPPPPPPPPPAGCGCCDASDWDPVGGCFERNGKTGLQCCCGNSCYRESNNDCLKNTGNCPKTPTPTACPPPPGGNPGPVTCFRSRSDQSELGLDFNDSVSNSDYYPLRLKKDGGGTDCSADPYYLCEPEYGGNQLQSSPVVIGGVDLSSSYDGWMHALSECDPPNWSSAAAFNCVDITGTVGNSCVYTGAAACGSGLSYDITASGITQNGEFESILFYVSLGNSNVPPNSEIKAFLGTPTWTSGTWAGFWFQRLYDLPVSDPITYWIYPTRRFGTNQRTLSELVNEIKTNPNIPDNYSLRIDANVVINGVFNTVGGTNIPLSTSACGCGMCTAITLTRDKDPICINQTSRFTADPTIVGTIDNVTFSVISGTGSVNPLTDTAPTYFTDFTPSTVSQTSTIQAECMTGGASSPDPPATAPVYVKPPTCTIDAGGAAGNMSLYPGESATKTFDAPADVSMACGKLDKLNFSCVNTARADVSPTSDDTDKYQTVVTAKFPSLASLPVSTNCSAAVINEELSKAFACAGDKWWNVQVKKPTCNIKLIPIFVELEPAETANLSVEIVSGMVGATPDYMAFDCADTTVAKVSPTSDSGIPYKTVVTGQDSPGNSTTCRARWYSTEYTLASEHICDATNTIKIKDRECEFTVSTLPVLNSALSLDPIPSESIDVEKFNTQLLVVSVVREQSGTVEKIRFTTSDESIVALRDSTGAPVTNPYDDLSVTYSVNVFANDIGSANVKIEGIMDDGNPYCHARVDTTVLNPDAWWQAQGGDIVAVGNITSDIAYCANPAGCIHPLLAPSLLAGPGSAILDGTLSLGNTPGNPPLGVIGGWLVENANLDIDTSKANYAFFEKEMPTGVTKETANTLNENELETGGTPDAGGSGYRVHWYQPTSGTLTLSDTDAAFTLGTNKIVLYVDGNLAIDDDIRLQDGRGFFMAIVSGNITINPSVGDGSVANLNPDLEGVYFAQGSFITSIGSEQFHARGAVATIAGYNLQRELDDNTVGPAEIFEHGFDQTMLMPNFVRFRPYDWREVAP